MTLAWYEMTEEFILPLHVSWRELADHWLTHDPLPEVKDDIRRAGLPLAPLVDAVSGPVGDIRARSAILQDPGEMDLGSYLSRDRTGSTD